MGKIAFKFEAETFEKSRIFEGAVGTTPEGDYTLDGTVLATPAGEEGVYVLTEAAGQFFGQRGEVAWSVIDD